MLISSLTLKGRLLAVCIMATIMLSVSTVDAAGIRSYASRIKASENNDNMLALLNGDADAMDQIAAAQEAIVQEEDEIASVLELLQQMANGQDEGFSMTPGGSDPDTLAPTVTASPSTSAMPSLSPSLSQMPSTSMIPSSVPSQVDSQVPTIVVLDDTPAPTDVPSGGGFGLPPISFGGLAPVEPTNLPLSAAATDFPSLTPSISSLPSLTPTAFPSSVPTLPPTTSPSDVPTTSPTLSTMPSTSPSAVPSSSPSITPSTTPSTSPTLGKCGMTPEERSTRIMSVLDSVVANPIDLRTDGTMQQQATEWLIEEDEFLVCPQDPKLVQRWALAVIYFATNGNDWLQCSRDGLDLCGFEDPFVGDSRFLSADHECGWAGISCDSQQCVNEIEFELNNLVGTIPTEIALLKELKIWGMERGGLEGKIPTEVGLLTNLIFIDLDFNKLTGSLTSELLSLVSLTQLDLNDNQMTGSISGIGVFPSMEFLQLHNNSFTGTVPNAVGSYTNLEAFTLHESNITGRMPPSVCGLLRNTSVIGGVLDSLIADCGGLNPEIVCECCTDCRGAGN